MPSEDSSLSKPPSQLEGIDVTHALEILSLRSSQNHQDDGHKPHDECHHHIPTGGNEMGQRIDMSASASEEAAEAMAPQQQELLQERKRRQKEIRDELSRRTVFELVQGVMEAQKGRVIAYREYDSGLEQVLKTGIMTDYPLCCTKATAAFSVLSDTINIISCILVEKHNRTDLQSLIRALQRQEQEKLSLTAALHLERIRESSHINEDDERVSNLLREGVILLKKRLAECVEGINEVLEELRFQNEELRL